MDEGLKIYDLQTDQNCNLGPFQLIHTIFYDEYKYPVFHIIRSKFL